MKTAHDLVLAAKACIEECSPTFANQLMNQSKPIVIDVREPDEYMQGHLPSALHIPRGLLEFKLASAPILDNREQAFLLYCKTGGRAALATKTMLEMGYQHVISISGGWEAWQAAALPTETPKPLAFE
ncbi:rhodanese-like domain-containing protein [Leeia sp. TBRC 13508]|uniref:Rhodanese-like domain-containing protein n=1 Tax=Leeia speluncae TaxID=2884804 RepID=A0ABS8D9N5_9NEIS|nr:rhodanese-like domain-containing protein [Leeia speluncae]MCB6184928.1 rhodanese-like domain-containing protein [Leeia speluncae]